MKRAAALTAEDIYREFSESLFRPACFELEISDKAVYTARAKRSGSVDVCLAVMKSVCGGPHRFGAANSDELLGCKAEIAVHG